ncbi:translation elongation factor-like protein [Candidatus Pacearchaeota archaeon]|nr:translation elongation factor-like protein [Candidatus Pacearchaeota archaeon]
MPEKAAKEKTIGKISTYFSHVGVAAVKISDKLKVGDKIRIKGNTTDFEQKVESMQIENEKVKEAKKGDHVGIKVSERVRPNDKVFLVK